MGRGKEAINEAGNHYGRLTVIKRGKVDRFGAVCWICKCTCGNIKEVSGSYLRASTVRSCGCLRPKLVGDEASFRSLFYQYRHASKGRGHEWNLSMEEFRYFTKQRCHYCGAEPYQTSYRRKTDEKYVYNGIDRVDSSGGYTMKNSVSCCGICNRAKGTVSYDVFLEWIDRLSQYENQNLRVRHG